MEMDVEDHSVLLVTSAALGARVSAMATVKGSGTRGWASSSMFLG